MAQQTESSWTATPAGQVTKEAAIYPPQHLRDFHRFLDSSKAPPLSAGARSADTSSDADHLRRVNAARVSF